MGLFRTSIIVLILNFPLCLWAWGEIGHKLIGAIAEEMMTPEARAFSRGIVGIEPLAVSSVWPDEVRDDARFGSRRDENDFSPYHFCEIPQGLDYPTNPKRIAKDCHAVIRYSEGILLSENFPRETKMITLRFLIHVIGDVHQPLHVGNGFDRGGNACKVKVRDSKSREARTTNFHSLWDTQMVEQMAQRLRKPNEPPPRYYPEILTALKSKHQNMFTEAAKQKYGNPSPDFGTWMKEAVELRETVYPDTTAERASMPQGEEYKNRKYCLWYVDQNKDKDPAPGSVIDESEIPTLDDEYFEKFSGVTEVQIIKAGLRVAAMFDRMAQEAKMKNLHQVDDKAQKSIFDTLFEKLKNVFP